MKKEKKYYAALLTIPLICWLETVRDNPIPGYKSSRMMYLLSAILTHKQDKHPGAWSLLYMVYLREVVPNAHQYIDYLISQEVIEIKNHLEGRNSRLYRIRKEFEGQAEFRTITDMELLTRIRKARIKIAKRNSRQYPELNRMTKLVQINYPAALATIEEKYTTTDNKEDAEARRTYSLAEVERIRSGEIFNTVNTTNNRYDSNFTRLPGELVQHLSINNKPLHEIDIVNSQIFFSVGIFDPTPEVTTVMREYLGLKFTIDTKRLQLSECDDFKRYALLATSGKFYEVMMTLFSLSDRSAAKDLVFTVLFSKNTAIRYSHEVRMFAKEFPSVWRMFSTIKAGGHNRLAILLQRIEADVMLNHVTPAILKQLPDVKFITKHDSILPASLLVAGDTAQVSELLANTIFSVTGSRPQLKIKEAKTEKSASQSNLQPINNTQPITTTNNHPSPSLYPITGTRTLQEVDKLNIERCTLIDNTKEKEKKIASQSNEKIRLTTTVADGKQPDSSGKGTSLPGAYFGQNK